VRRGVKVAFGTDQSHRLMVGENLAEMRFMVDWLGMSPMDVIVSATSRAAECIGRPDVGALEVGRKADVLVVDGDPLSDVTVLERRENLKLVMKDGNAFTNMLA
jgi:imidazolonepropionase-like amidohydrolase